MMEDRIVCAAKEAKGSIKETGGKVVGGPIVKAERKVQNAAGELKLMCSRIGSRRHPYVRFGYLGAPR